MRVSDDELSRMIENEEHIGDRRIAMCLRELQLAREALARIAELGTCATGENETEALQRCEAIARFAMGEDSHLRHLLKSESIAMRRKECGK